MIKQRSTKSRLREAFAHVIESEKKSNKSQSRIVRLRERVERTPSLVRELLDIAGTHLNVPALGSLEQDREIIQEDFRVVGNDMKNLLRNQLNFLPRQA